MVGHSTEDKKDYVWHKVNVFTRWWPTGRYIVINFDAPPALRMRFPSLLFDEPNSTSTHDPYWIHLRFLEELVALHDTSVWSIRDLVRDTELVHGTCFARSLLANTGSRTEPLWHVQIQIIYAFTK